MAPSTEQPRVLLKSTAGIVRAHKELVYMTDNIPYVSDFQSLETWSA